MLRACAHNWTHKSRLLLQHFPPLLVLIIPFLFFACTICNNTHFLTYEAPASSLGRYASESHSPSFHLCFSHCSHASHIHCRVCVTMCGRRKDGDGLSSLFSLTHTCYAFCSAHNTKRISDRNESKMCVRGKKDNCWRREKNERRKKSASE